MASLREGRKGGKLGCLKGGDSYNILSVYGGSRKEEYTLVGVNVVGCGVFSGPGWSLWGSTVSIRAILSLYICVWRL